MKENFWKIWHKVVNDKFWLIVFGSAVFLIIFLFLFDLTPLATFLQYHSDSSARGWTYLPTELFAIPLILITMFLFSVILVKWEIRKK
jgi:hypothetical protein